MNVYQTINVPDSQQLNALLRQYEDTHLDGIRINLCKFPMDQLKDKSTEIFKICSQFRNRYKFLFDLAYPKQKSRIADIKIYDCFIEENKEYCITLSQDLFSDKTNDIILLNGSFKNVKKGDVLYFGDGEGAFQVEDVSEYEIKVRALNDFEIYKNKAISKGYLNTCEDYCSLVQGFLDIDLNLTFLLSFVEDVSEVRTFRQILCGNYDVLAKIETENGIKNCESILDECNGIVAARGDLALTTKCINLAEHCKYICNNAEKKRKRIMFATDILSSMRERIIPARSELFDLFLMREFKATDIVLPYFQNERKECIQNKLEIIKNMF